MGKIKFLGTGSLEGIPSPLCKCPVCRSARKGGKDRRFRSSIYVELEDTSMIIDCTPDFKNQIEEYNVPIENIFITHGHWDHFYGIGELSYMVPLYNIHPTIIGKTEVLELCERSFIFVKANFKKLEEFSFKIGKNKIELIPVEHAKNTSTNGLFFNNILIIPEVYRIPQETLDYLKKKDIDILIIDGAYYGKAIYKDHFTIQKALDFSKKINAKKVIITNIWHKTKTHSELEEEFGKEAIVAYDGLEVSF